MSKRVLNAKNCKSGDFSRAQAWEWNTRHSKVDAAGRVGARRLRDSAKRGSAMDRDGSADDSSIGRAAETRKRWGAVGRRRGRYSTFVRRNRERQSWVEAALCSLHGVCCGERAVEAASFR